MTTTCVARFAPADPDLYYTLQGKLEKEYQTATFVPEKVHEKLFSSIEEANQHFQKLREIENGPERQNDVFEVSEYRLRVELRHDLQMLPIVSVLNLSRHLQDPDEQVRKLAERACCILAIYNACVRQVLENTDANMQRQDLLAHCIGPTNNLFAYYGLYPHRPDEYDRGYWFTHCRLPNQDAYVDRDRQLVFGLDESTPYECESAIRDALADLEVPLPPRIF